MGPLRGDNSFPPSNKPAARDTSRTESTKEQDDDSGPGGKYGKGSEFESAHADTGGGGAGEAG
jgi:hypothetical protein